MTGMLNTKDKEALRALRDDFEATLDPARDDMVFIYFWTPPVWMKDPGWGPEGAEAVTEIVVMLERVLAALDQA